MRFRVLANLGIQALSQCDIENMLTLESALLEAFCKGQRQLLVDEELHECRSTT